MRLSIITINYNNLSGLRKTLDSVKRQQNADFEHIIVDGASDDGSVELIESYSCGKTYPIKWTSEKDTGIYNAMNKGIGMSEGEYVLFLNSGDYLVHSSVCKDVIPYLDGTDIIQGNTIENDGFRTFRNRGFGKSELTFYDIIKGYFLHQASFCRKQLFDEYGRFDESYRINGDTVFFYRCLGLGNASFKYIDFDIADYDMSGVSSSQNKKYQDVRVRENERMRRETFTLRMLQSFDTDVPKLRFYDEVFKHGFTRFFAKILGRVACLFNRAKSNNVPMREEL